jgi:Fur family ferric uptake transcriptional regulator
MAMKTLNSSSPPLAPRNTRQKEVVRAVLERSNRPLTAAEIHEEGRKAIPRLGLNTVYRLIQELVSQGSVLGVDYPGQPLRYEWATGRHVPHLLCRDCGKVFPIDAEVPDVPVSVPAGFSLEGQELILFATCLKKRCPHKATAQS